MIQSSVKNPPEIEIKVHSIPPPPLHTQPPPPPPPRPPRNHQSSKEWFVWLVPSIFIVNVTLFIISMYINSCPAHSRSCIGVKILHRLAFENVKVNPDLGPSPATLIKMGALDAKKVIQEDERWRVLTSMWLHGVIFHIFPTMLGLLIIGIPLEKEFGFAIIGSIYILSGMGGGIMSCLFLQKNISVGASGALFGLLGALLSELLTNWTIYNNKCAAVTNIILMILVNILVGFFPPANNFAHIGGFLTGFFNGFILLIRPHFKRMNHVVLPGFYAYPLIKYEYKTYRYILVFISATALTLMYITGFVLVSEKVNMHEYYCSWCHYVSCVPMPKSICDQR